MYEQFDAFLSDSPSHNETYVFVIAGDDRVVHQFINAYQRAYKLNPERNRRIKIKLLILPWGMNHLASFISRYDSWYQRHIYNLFRSETFVLPWIRLNDGDDVLLCNDGGEISKPGKFFRQSVENYAREACHTTNIMIYELQAWTNASFSGAYGNSPNEEPDQIISFCQRVEFKMKGQGDGIPREAIVSFMKMDLRGICTREVQEKCAFDRLLVSNIQWGNDPWHFPPNPMMPWLEMFIEVNSVAGNRSSLATDKMHHIDSLVLTCKDPSDKFSANIDGQPFGPFHHIQISRATINKSDKKIISSKKIEENQDEWYSENESEEILKQLQQNSITLPIQTFFPIKM